MRHLICMATTYYFMTYFCSVHTHVMCHQTMVSMSIHRVMTHHLSLTHTYDAQQLDQCISAYLLCTISYIASIPLVMCMGHYAILLPYNMYIFRLRNTYLRKWLQNICTHLNPSPWLYQVEVQFMFRCCFFHLRWLYFHWQTTALDIIADDDDNDITEYLAMFHKNDYQPALGLWSATSGPGWAMGNGLTGIILLV